MSDGSLDIIDSGASYNTGRNQARCFDSNTCAAGWACVGGFCAQSAGGSRSGCGDDYEDGSSCGGNGVNDCTKSACGESGISPGNNNCCDGLRCCRRDSSGKIQCRCGPCSPPPSSCSRWCDGYEEALGKKGPNCSDVTKCSECETCAFQGIDSPDQCEPLGGNAAPCNCAEDPQPPGPCKKCGENGIWVADEENCETCWQVEVSCGCARTTEVCCLPGSGSQAGKSQCQSRALANCYKFCDGGGDDGGDDACVGNCTGVTWCPPDQPEPPCPPQTTCTANGSISAGGKTCFIRTDCNKSNVPDSCGECDCNCVDDCPDCKICNANGKCVDDPNCLYDHYNIVMTFSSCGWSSSVGKQWYRTVGTGVVCDSSKGGCPTFVSLEGTMGCDYPGAGGYNGILVYMNIIWPNGQTERITILTGFGVQTEYYTFSFAYSNGPPTGVGTTEIPDPGSSSPSVIRPDPNRRWGEQFF